MQVKPILNLITKYADDIGFGVRNCTRPQSLEGLRFAPELIGDTVNISKNTLLQRVLGTQTAEKGIYDVTKWQKEFFAQTYDKLKTPEEKAVYIGKLRLVFERIKRDIDINYEDLEMEDKINFIKRNFQYLHHQSQDSLVSLLEKNEIPKTFNFDFDNNKMFELILKNKEYNLDYVTKEMQRPKYAYLFEKALEFSQKIDENIARLGIKLPQQNAYEIAQQLKASEIDKSIYHELPLYHGVRGGDEAYKMALFKEHGSSRFGPINATGANILFTTDDLHYAERYGGANVLKMYCRKDYPILNCVDITSGIKHGDGWSEERLIYDLLYEKGIKFLKNGRETLIIDPKAVTFVSDFKNNFIP